ncbi:MAG TPA: glycerol-3-phosphate dehydrogenase [Polyangiaceae bacterium]|nr:glycerol-3-phosphate dehydrogenase [Polyangiaceae bacterium]
MAVFTVLGAGMMGSALCVPLVDRGHEVRLVGTPLDRDIVEGLRCDHVHLTLKHALPEAIVPYHVEQLGEAMQGCDALALGVSSAGIDWACETIAPHVRPGLPLFMITKGLTWDGERLHVLPDVVKAKLPVGVRDDVHPAAVAGPCIAGELARRVPSCVILAGRHQPTLTELAELLRADYYHVWTSTDVVGVEACAALKNAYAMGVAFGTGMHVARGGEPGSVAMHNVESAVFAQALLEMGLIIEAMGGDGRRAAGLAGAGDLDVTNNGGRTGRFGRWLGTGLSREAAIEKMAGATLECLEIIAVMREASRGLIAAGKLAAGSLPLLDHMAEVVLDDRPVDIPFEAFFGGSR